MCIRCECVCEGICCRGVEGGSPVLFGRAGQLFYVGEHAAVCAPGLIEGGVRGDWGVLLRCICGFLSYACAVELVIPVFHDGGDELGWNWYSRLLYAVQSFCVICRLSMRVFAVLGSQEGCAYERICGCCSFFTYGGPSVAMTRARPSSLAHGCLTTEGLLLLAVLDDGLCHLEEVIGVVLPAKQESKLWVVFFFIFCHLLEFWAISGNELSKFVDDVFQFLIRRGLWGVHCEVNSILARFLEINFRKCT